MKWAGYLFLMLGLAGRAAAQEEPAGQNGSSFRAFDVFVDSGEAPLAAYQIECAATNGAARIVGIEGGEHRAFHEPPFYDPKAMQHERVVIAAFSTNAADQLPHGRTRVATLHLQVSAGQTVEIGLNIQAGADSEGKRIALQASIKERKIK